jgi:hypothetical protein
MLLVALNEATAARRLVPFWLVQSNGTSAATVEAGNTPQWSLNGGAFVNAANTLSAVSANAGRYTLQLTQSETSVLGTLMFRHSSTTCFEQGSTPAVAQIVAQSPYVNVWDEPRSTHTDLTTYGWTLQVPSAKTIQGVADTSNITLSSSESARDGLYNGCFIQFQYPDGTYYGDYISVYTGSTKGVKLQTALPAAASSGMSYTIFPSAALPDLGTVWNASRSAYSNAGSFGQYVYSQLTGGSSGTVNTANFPSSGGSTAQEVASEVWSYGTRNMNSMSTATMLGVVSVGTVQLPGSNFSVVLKPQFHSGATISGVSNTVNFPSSQSATVAEAVWSSYQTRTLLGDSSAATIGFVRSVLTANALSDVGARSVASSVWSTNFGNNRWAFEAMYAQRNRVDVGTSQLTVYQPDDATPQWTASVTSAQFGIGSIDPAG